jgi:sentrin-specific protease 1
MHWCLAVVDMDTKEINYYDSMGGNNNRCLDALKKYLNEEHKAKKGSPLDMSEWHTSLKKDIPQQMNGSDCGMFACKFSEYLSRRKRISFTQANMPLFRRRMIYEIVKNDLLHP